MKTCTVVSAFSLPKFQCADEVYTIDRPESHKLPLCTLNTLKILLRNISTRRAALIQFERTFSRSRRLIIEAIFTRGCRRGSAGGSRKSPITAC